MSQFALHQIQVNDRNPEHEVPDEVSQQQRDLVAGLSMHELVRLLPQDPLFLVAMAQIPGFKESVALAQTGSALPAQSVDSVPVTTDKIGPPITAKPAKRKATAASTVNTSSRLLAENSSSASSDSDPSAESSTLPAPVSVSYFILFLSFTDFYHVFS